VVRIGHTHEEFIALIQDAMSDHTPAAVDARLAVAQENTWDHRVETLNDILDRHLAQRAKV